MTRYFLNLRKGLMLGFILVAPGQVSALDIKDYGAPKLDWQHDFDGEITAFATDCSGKQVAVGVSYCKYDSTGTKHIQCSAPSKLIHFTDKKIDWQLEISTSVRVANISISCDGNQIGASFATFEKLKDPHALENGPKYYTAWRTPYYSVLYSSSGVAEMTNRQHGYIFFSKDGRLMFLASNNPKDGEGHGVASEYFSDAGNLYDPGIVYLYKDRQLLGEYHGQLLDGEPSNHIPIGDSVYDMDGKKTWKFHSERVTAGNNDWELLYWGDYAIAKVYSGHALSNPLFCLNIKTRKTLWERESLGSAYTILDNEAGHLLTLDSDYNTKIRTFQIFDLKTGKELSSWRSKSGLGPRYIYLSRVLITTASDEKRYAYVAWDITGFKKMWEFDLPRSEIIWGNGAQTYSARTYFVRDGFWLKKQKKLERYQYSKI